MKNNLRFLMMFLSFVLIFSTLSPAVLAAESLKNNAIEVTIKSIEPSTENIFENTMIFKDKTELVNSIEMSMNDVTYTSEFFEITKNTTPHELISDGFSPSELVRITYEGISQDFYLSYNDIYYDFPTESEVKPRCPIQLIRGDWFPNFYLGTFFSFNLYT